MSFKIKKKNLVLSGLVLLLGGAVFANWYLTGNGRQILKPDVDSSVSQEAGVNLGEAQYVNAEGAANQFFANAKIKRDSSYDKSIAGLKEIIDNENSDKEAVKTASASLADISDNKVKESNIETLITAKIGGQCVCIINDKSVDVIVDEKYITDNSVLQIKEIIKNNSKTGVENISIIPAK